VISQSTIQVSECYRLHVSRIDTAAMQTLTISSQFTGAKDPNEQRQLLRLSLEPEVMSELAVAIFQLVNGDSNDQ